MKLFRETATRRSFTNGCCTTQCIQVFCCRRCTSRTRFYFSWNCRASGMRKSFMNPTVLHGAIVGETCLALQFHEKVAPCNIGCKRTVNGKCTTRYQKVALNYCITFSRCDGRAKYSKLLTGGPVDILKNQSPDYPKTQVCLQPRSQALSSHGPEVGLSLI